MKSRLKEKYVKEIVPKLMKDLTLENIMQVPRIEKNMFKSRYWFCSLG